MIDMAWLRAGNAVFTVSSPKGGRYTYKVRKKVSAAYGVTWFVLLLTGPENTSGYTYMGVLDTHGGLRLTRASKYNRETVPVKVFEWALAVIQGTKPLPPEYAIQHAGRCCRCGRMLTVPESIESGIGPECAGKVGR